MKSIENLTIRDYLGIFWRRKWYVILTTIVVSVGAFIYVKRLPSVYRSETTLLISSRLLPEDYIRSLDRLTNNERIDSLTRQLRSRTFLERIVREFQLTPPGVAIETATNAINTNIEITPLSNNALKIAYYATEPNLAQAVTRRLAEMVIQLNDSAGREKVQLADQFLEEQQRQASAEMIDIEAKLLQFRNEHFQGLSTASVTSDSIRELEMELARIDTTLEEYRDSRAALQRRLQDQKGLIAMMNTMAAAPSTAAEASGPDAAPAASIYDRALEAKRAELAAATTRYTNIHPEVVRLNRELKELESLAQQNRAETPAPVRPAAPGLADSGIDAAVELAQREVEIELDKIGSEIAKTEQARTVLINRMALYQSRLNPSPELAQELNTLERDFEAAQQRFKVLANQALNAKLASSVDASEDNEVFRVIDAAFLPLDPVRPNRRMLYALGGMAGLLLGLGCAFLRELVDPSLHNEADAVAELRVPVLAGIPNVMIEGEKKRRKKLSPLTVLQVGEPEDSSRFNLKGAESKIRDIILNPLAPAGEPYRLMHAKLSLMQRERGVKSILITSAIPNEGKTFASCCLAGVLARDAGKKVLLIDADLRTGSAGRALGITAERVGLNDLLAASPADVTMSDPGNEPAGELLLDAPDLEHATITCTDVNMSFLHSGTTPEKPGQLFNEPRLENLIRQAETIYDWVIIDSPPVLALSDATLLAPLCDATLVVVRSGKTDATLVKDSIQRIGPERICGLLMNRMRMTNANYYSYYGRSADLKKLKA